jgi:hypothetical protein
MRVKNGAVRGYVKPLFKEMDLYDPPHDQEKYLFQKIYEGLVGGVSQLLENVPRREVATKADISGRLEDPQASTWQVLVNLVQNATFRAILPGFERKVGRSQRLKTDPCPSRWVAPPPRCGDNAFNLRRIPLQAVFPSHYEKARSLATCFSLNNGLWVTERRLPSEIRSQGVLVQLDLGEILAAHARLF